LPQIKKAQNIASKIKGAKYCLKDKRRKILRLKDKRRKILPQIKKAQNITPQRARNPEIADKKNNHGR